MFSSTQPAAETDLMRVSEFQRRQRVAPREAHTDTGAGTTRLTSLNPSLLHDLLRYDTAAGPGAGLDLLEVLAAAVRHARALLIQVQHDYRVLPLTVFPTQRLVHSPLHLPQLLELRLPDLRVLHVEPARLRPDDESASLVPLGPVLWELALRGSREALLPEIAGTAAYRVTPGADLGALDLSGSLAAAALRLRQQTTTLREIATWPGFDQERATRMLNGLYLQAALMVSRTHPAATNAGWVSGKN